MAPDAEVCWGGCALGAHRAEGGGSRWHPGLATACFWGWGGPEDKEGPLAEASLPASSNFCQNQLIGCFARFEASLSTKSAHLPARPRRGVWLLFQPHSCAEATATVCWGLCPCRGVQWAGSGAPGSESEAGRCRCLWAWARPFSSLGLSPLLCETGWTHFLGLM